MEEFISLQAKVLGSCRERANPRWLWQSERFLATYLSDLSQGGLKSLLDMEVVKKR